MDNSIIELTNIDYSVLVTQVLIILFAVKAVFSLFEWLGKKFGIETKYMRAKREEHELLIQTSQNLFALQEKHKDDMEQERKHIDEMQKHIEDMQKGMQKLTEMFVDKEINDMRWEINNFATKVSEGKPCNKDSFKHCIHTYEKYEKLLEENNLENGEVEISMLIVNEAYKQKLKEGF